MRISDWSSDVCSSDLAAQHGRPRREAEPFSRPALRRPAAACRHRPRARHASQDHAVRRGHLGARPGAGRRGAERDPQAWLRDRKSVVEGKSVSVRLDLGGRRNLKKKKITNTEIRYKKI